jgi:hypothetical protein
MIHQRLASVSLLIAVEVLLTMKVQKLKIRQKGIFLQHILYIDYCCYLVVMDVKTGYVVGDEEQEECFAVFAAEVADAQDDFDEDCDSFVDVANIFVVTNDVVSVVGDN